MQRKWIAAILWAAACAAPVFGGALDEFRVKRTETFEFAANGKPRVTREGDRITIAFAVKAPCDAVVAIEGPDGRIVRHLACGVLGDNAPAPFARGTLEQSIVWDGKNDQDEYVDNKDQLGVRVSLGLKAAFEKTLYWEPKRRHGMHAPVMQSAPEGVYVYDGGNGIDFVKLYNHDGSYQRMLYPFPGDRIGQVKGLPQVTYPQDGATLPKKATFLQQTFLTCGNLYGYEYPGKYPFGAEQAGGNSHYGMYNNAASFLAVAGTRLVLGKTYLFRMATDGSSGGLDAEGPAVALVTKGRGFDTGGRMVGVAPHSAALSPDGKTLYLAGYLVCHLSHASADIIGNGEWDAFHAVYKMDVAGEKPPELFAGSAEVGKSGADNKSFNVPASVAVDKAGRVYVADHLNNRIQVFGADGGFLKSIAATRPAVVCIAGKSQEIYVFSSYVYSRETGGKQEKIVPTLTVFQSFDNPQKKLSCPLPAGFGADLNGFWYSGNGLPLSAAVDDAGDKPRVWMAMEWARENVMNRGKVVTPNIAVFTLEGNALQPADNFGRDVEKSIKRAEPPRYARARLYANPRSGKLYAAYGEAYDWKSFKTLIEIDPETGKNKIVDLPFDAEDMCFDATGYAYLRNISMVVRYVPEGWREIPWDYGEERKGVCTSASSDRKETAAVSGLPLPADGGWHHGGMYVSLRGNLLVACGATLEAPKEKYSTGAVAQAGKPYSPPMYPGRSIAGRGGAPLLHIWDKHGKVLFEDALPGIGGNTYGLGLDRDNGIYMMHNATRVIDGKPYLNKLSGTLIKVMPNKAKVLCQAAPIPLAEANAPKRPVDLVGSGLPGAWIENAEWLYGGVGYDGKNAGIGCACWNARMAFDSFARSFAPELDRYHVAVLDAAGNLILRIGRYGNADSAGAGSLVPLGGDEVGMVHGAYLATITDRRLFVADTASDRIFSVKLDYAATERVALKDAAGAGKKAQ
jgi:hypothetical protein